MIYPLLSINILNRYQCSVTSQINNQSVTKYNRLVFDELSRLREIQRSYAKQTEIEGLSKYSRPRVGEIDLIFRKMLFTNRKLGEGIVDI